MKKLPISTFAGAVMLLFGGVNEVNADPLTYEVSGDTVSIIDCKTSATGDLVIPSTYAGKSVTTIENFAFSDCSSLTSVIIPDSVNSIGEWAFYDCSSLTNIYFESNAPSIRWDVFREVSKNAKIFVNPSATGFGETFAGLPVQILEKTLKINTFSKSASPFSLTFETQSDSTYKIEASHDLKKWGEIGEVQGTGSSVELTDWREALFQKQYYRVKMAE